MIRATAQKQIIRHLTSSFSSKLTINRAIYEWPALQAFSSQWSEIKS